MDERASQHVARPSIDLLAGQAGEATKSLWARLRAWLADYQRRRVAAALYAELSKLSDAELERRGIAPGDLARHCAGRAFSTEF